MTTVTILDGASRAVLAVNNFGDTEYGGLAGPMGLFIILLLLVATVLLIRNMNKRIRRLPERFPDPDGAPDDSVGRAAQVDQSRRIDQSAQVDRSTHADDSL